MLRLLANIIFIVILLLGQAATADIVIRPWIKNQGEFDSNRRLRDTEKEDVVGNILELGSRASLEKPKYTASVTPRFRLQRFDNDTGLNAEEYFVDSNFSRFLERGVLALEFSFEREASIASEISDSGIASINVPKTTFSLQGSWVHQFTDKLSNVIYATAQDVSFEEDPASPFVDYVAFSAGSNLSFQTNQRTRLLANFGISEFKAPSTSLSTRSFTFTVGAERLITDTLTASLLVGKNIGHTEFKSLQQTLVSISPLVIVENLVDDEDRTTGDLISFFAEKKFERGNLRLEWNRSFAPASQGVRREAQDVNGFGRYQFSQDLWNELRVFYRESSQEGDFASQVLEQLQVLTVTSSTFWRISKPLRLEGGLRFRKIIRLRREIEVDSFSVFVGLRFSPDEFAIKLF